MLRFIAMILPLAVCLSCVARRSHSPGSRSSSLSHRSHSGRSYKHISNYLYFEPTHAILSSVPKSYVRRVAVRFVRLGIFLLVFLGALVRPHSASGQSDCDRANAGDDCTFKVPLDIPTPTRRPRPELTVPTPTMISDCDRPPESFNPYSYQPGFSVDTHTFNPYTTTLTPYSGDPEPNANIYHEPKKEGDERGHWERQDFVVNWTGSNKMFLAADVVAFITDAKGSPSLFGDYISIGNNNKAPVYFGLSTSVLNDKLMPGEHRIINLGLYQPKTGHKLVASQTINVKYWVSEGPAPSGYRSVRCSSWSVYYSSLSKMDRKRYADARFFIPWSYSKTVQDSELLGSSAELDFTFGKWTYSCGKSSETEVFENDGNSPVFVEASFRPGFPDVFYVPPGMHQTLNFTHGCAGTPSNVTVDVAIVPPDGSTNPYAH